MQKWCFIFVPALIGAFAVSAFGGSYYDNVLSLSPTGYYRLNETELGVVTDYSGNGLDAFHTEYTPGALTAFSQPGALEPHDSDYSVTGSGLMPIGDISAHAADALASGHDPFTVSFWVNPASFGAGDFATPFSIGGLPAEKYNGFLIAENGVEGDGRLRIGRYYEDFLVSQNSLNLGVWNHVAASYDGMNLKLFINGQLDSTATVTLSVGAGGTDVNAAAVGSFMNQNQFFDGGLDEFAYYKTALADTDVTALADPSAGGGDYAAFVGNLGPSAYYRLNESGVGVMADSSGNGYDGVYLDDQDPGALANLNYTPGALDPVDADSAVLCSVGHDAVGFYPVASDWISSEPIGERPSPPAICSPATPAATAPSAAPTWTSSAPTGAEHPPPPFPNRG